MRINFSGMKSAAGNGPIPPGEYLARVASVKEKQTRDGKTYWNVALEVLEGDFAGRFVFDNIFFTPQAIPRLKIILDALGIAVDGELEVEPDDLRDRRALVQVERDQYSKDGAMQQGNKITYDGYRAVKEQTPPAPSPARAASPATAQRSAATSRAIAPQARATSVHDAGAGRFPAPSTRPSPAQLDQGPTEEVPF